MQRVRFSKELSNCGKLFRLVLCLMIKIHKVPAIENEYSQNLWRVWVWVCSDENGIARQQLSQFKLQTIMAYLKSQRLRFNGTTKNSKMFITLTLYDSRFMYEREMEGEASFLYNYRFSNSKIKINVNFMSFESHYVCHYWDKRLGQRYFC